MNESLVTFISIKRLTLTVYTLRAWWSITLKSTSFRSSFLLDPGGFTSGIPTSSFNKPYHRWIKLSILITTRNLYQQNYIDTKAINTKSWIGRGVSFPDITVAVSLFKINHNILWKKYGRQHFFLTIFDFDIIYVCMLW